MAGASTGKDQVDPDPGMISPKCSTANRRPLPKILTRPEARQSAQNLLANARPKPADQPEPSSPNAEYRPANHTTAPAPTVTAAEARSPEPEPDPEPDPAPGSALATTAPRFPTPEPPYTPASLFNTSRQTPAHGIVTR